jgi:formylmethanofuran dehydrogenase subunit E
MTPEKFQSAVIRAMDIAVARAKADELWDKAFRAIVRALDERLHAEWDGKSRPTRFLGKKLRGLGFPDKVVEAVMTALGEAIEALEKRRELIVARGKEIVTWYDVFNDIAGLRSCMSGKGEARLAVYTQHPTLVSLWVLMDNDGKPAARALMWEKARVKVGEEWREEQRVLDRVYYVSASARDRMLDLAEEAGAWVRTRQTFDDLTAEYPIVSPSREEATIARVYLDWEVWLSPDKREWPYMDTFKYLRFTPEGKLMLSTRKPKRGGYGRCDMTNGDYSDHGLHWEWRKISGGAQARDEEEDSGRLQCARCQVALHEDEAHEHDGEVYCEECFRELFFVCAGCGNTFHVDEARRAEDELYCEPCHSRTFANCTHCGELIHREDIYYAFCDPYCEHCYIDLFIECDECGRPMHRGDEYLVDGEVYCEWCYNDLFVACDECNELVCREDAVRMGDNVYCGCCAEVQKQDGDDEADTPGVDGIVSGRA